MSRKTYYQTGTSRPEHQLPSVYDGEKKKQQEKRQMTKQRKQAKPEQMAASPLPDLPEYNQQYVVPPTPGWGFVPEPLPPGDSDHQIGDGEDSGDQMDIDEPDVPRANHVPFRYFNQQPTVPQFSQPFGYFNQQLAVPQFSQSFRSFNKDPISAFLDPISEPEYYEGNF